MTTTVQPTSGAAKYPGARYHKKHGVRVANDEKEDAALKKMGFTEAPEPKEDDPGFFAPRDQKAPPASVPVPGHQHQPYPSVRYHKKKGQMVVATPDEDKSLGEGWRDTPFSEEELTEPEPESKVEKKPKPDDKKDE